MSTPCFLINSMEEFIQRAAEPPAPDASHDTVIRHILLRKGPTIVWVEQTKLRDYGEDSCWENVYFHGCEVALGKLERYPAAPENKDILYKARRAQQLKLQVSIPEPIYIQPTKLFIESEFTRCVLAAFEKGRWDFPGTLNKQPIPLRSYIDKDVCFFVDPLPPGLWIDESRSGDPHQFTAFQCIKDGVPQKISIPVKIKRMCFGDRLLYHGTYYTPTDFLKETEKALLQFQQAIPAIHKSFEAWANQYWDQSRVKREAKERQELAQLFNVPLPVQ